MTYVTDQTSAQLHAHMKRLKAMPGWHEPLADRLYTEIEALEADKLRVMRGQFTQMCSYCGWEAPASGASWDELQAHIKVCEKHPVTALQAEVERLTLERDVNKRMRDQHFAEAGQLRAQLAAAQGQEPVGTIHEDGYWVRANNPTGNAISDAMSSGKMNRLTVYAAPIPQQPAQPRPVYGKPGTRDVDVAEAMKRWDAAQKPAAWPQFTTKECHDLTAMIYGAPWADEYCEGLVEVLGKYEELRTAGQRPVDPVDSGIPPSGPTEPAHPNGQLEAVHMAAADLMLAAASADLVVTLERRPLHPLAMGHAEYVVETRPVRVKS